MSKDKAKVVQHPAKKTAESASIAPFAIGFVALDLAVIMTVLLVLQKIGSIDLPGCGPQSACAMAQSSAWGRLPIGSLELPVSFMGLGYFAGMLAAWLISRGRLSSPLRALVFIGAAVSLVYMGVILMQGHYCPYCIGTHIANFIFAGVVLRSPIPTSYSVAPVAAAGAILLAANLILMAVKSSSEAAQAQKQEGQLQKSTQEIANQGKASTPVNTAINAGTPDKSDKPWTGPFTGRYRQGPEKARYRIVLYTDYQCPDCYNVEKDIVEMMKTRDDVSLSAKQFPFNKDCNPGMSQTLHQGACLAASMAEAAGILRGNEGFWQMHHALFERQGYTPKGIQGGFANGEEYAQFLMQLGYDQASFEQVRQNDPRIMQWIKSDCEEAVALGLFYTPMVFINGVELKGVFAPQAVSRAIAALDASNLPAKGPEDDNPPLAPERHVSDWRESPPSPMPVDAMTFGRGPADAKVKISIIGDYQEPGTLEALNQVRQLTASRNDVRVEFRLFPFNRECNPRLPAPQPGKPDISQFPKGCIAARAAKAAGIVGGPDGFWKMHDWLIQNSAVVSDQSVVAAVGTLGLDTAAFTAAMNGPQAQAAISTDANSLYGYLFKTGIPTVRVNDKVIPRWKLKGDNIIERVFKEADKP